MSEGLDQSGGGALHGHAQPGRIPAEGGSPRIVGVVLGDIDVSDHEGLRVSVADSKKLMPSPVNTRANLRPDRIAGAELHTKP